MAFLPRAAARRRAATRTLASAVVGVVAAAYSYYSFFVLGEASFRGEVLAGVAFVGAAGRPQPARPAILRLRAEGGEELGLAEAPSDVELAEKNVDRPRPARSDYKPKRDIRGKLSYVRRELREEADRFLPYIQPLLARQFSLREVTFALNRQGSKLRHLLFRPRCGLPVFTTHKVRSLMRLASVKPRLIQYKRPGRWPPNAPAAPYPPIMGDCFAEVPPLKPWTAETAELEPVAEAAAASGKDEEAEAEAPADADKKPPEDIDELFG